MRCTVVGAGAWGTALAHVLASNGHETCLWAYEEDVAASVNARHENTRFLAGAALARTLRAGTDHRSALEGAEFVLYATPSQHLRTIARAGAAYVSANAILGVASKGIERDTLALMSDVVEAEVPGRPVVAVTGPSFAAEVAARQPTAILAASPHAAAATVAQQALSNNWFRVYTSADLIGAEVGGALKNVMAVATGIAEGAGLGFNSRAALITRGLAEMSRLGVALGAHAATFAGLAGIGDLVLTCTGALSRNRAVGLEIGKGATLEQALEGKQTVAEGVQTSAQAQALAQRHGVDMPIVEAVNRVLFEGRPPLEAIGELMSRDLRREH